MMRADWMQSYLGLEGLDPCFTEGKGLRIVDGSALEVRFVCAVLVACVESLGSKLERRVLLCCRDGAEDHVPRGVVV